MPAGIPAEVYELVKDIMYGMVRSDLDSPDVTYQVFQRIDIRPQLLQRYQKIVEGKKVETVHKQIGKAVKLFGKRENDAENHEPPALRNIRLTSYMRFKPYDAQ